MSLCECGARPVNHVPGGIHCRGAVIADEVRGARDAPRTYSGTCHHEFKDRPCGLVGRREEVVDRVLALLRTEWPQALREDAAKLIDLRSRGMSLRIPGPGPHRRVRVAESGAVRVATLVRKNGDPHRWSVSKVRTLG